MNYQPYIVFKLNHSYYGIEAAAVQEIFFLPEIVPIAEASPSIVGVINLRGEILPVMNLHQRLGLKVPPYELTDSIIVLQCHTERVGVSVNQVCEVKFIAVDEIQSRITSERSPAFATHSFVTGIVNVEDDIITILNPERLVQHSYVAALSVHNGHLSTENGHTAVQTIDPSETADLYTHLAPEARQKLQERSKSLRQLLATQDSTQLIPLAVMGLAGEYWGLGLKTVHEFTTIHRIAPVPCCPSHILGNMNLRGEIVTLVDISPVINLSLHRRTTKQKAIVVRVDDLTVGIAVDDIFDIVHVDPSQILTAPVATHSTNDEYLQGVTPYRDKMMSIIDLPRILRSGTLVVNEEV